TPPRRAKTRRSAGKAAASEEATSYSPLYVEPLNDARTPLGDQRVPARRAGGCHGDFFNSLLGNPTRWLAWSILLALSACSARQFTTVTLYDSPHSFVRLEADPTVDSNGAHSHPVRLTPEQVAAVLRGVIVEEPITRMPLYDDLSVPRRHHAFDDRLTAFLAPLLALGLERATPEEVVTFYFSKQLSGVTREVTSGGLFVHGEDLHVILANHRSHTNYMADYGAASTTDDRLTPMKSLAPQQGRLAFEPPSALRPSQAGIWSKFFQADKRELIVAYKELTPAPLVSTPPAETPRP
ncbi:MAG TPA: hypothetical protein PKA61_08560, partial [Nitrospira sp.]|nr:hypothetical protein [Nitrospira sp.]